MGVKTRGIGGLIEKLNLHSNKTTNTLQSSCCYILSTPIEQQIEIQGERSFLLA
jgi:hypothetical protein